MTDEEWALACAVVADAAGVSIERAADALNALRTKLDWSSPSEVAQKVSEACYDIMAE